MTLTLDDLPPTLQAHARASLGWALAIPGAVATVDRTPDGWLVLVLVNAREIAVLLLPNAPAMA